VSSTLPGSYYLCKEDVFSPASVAVSVCLSVCEQYYTKSRRMIFINPCTVVDFCYGKNALNVRVDLAIWPSYFDCGTMYGNQSMFARWRLRVVYRAHGCRSVLKSGVRMSHFRLSNWFRFRPTSI